MCMSFQNNFENQHAASKPIENDHWLENKIQNLKMLYIFLKNIVNYWIFWPFDKTLYNPVRNVYNEDQNVKYLAITKLIRKWLLGKYREIIGRVL